MQRLAKPSDYVLQEVLGQQMYLIPWEPRMCPGNPADDPELGAQLYNEFACAAAQGVTQRSPAEKTADIIDWAITTPEKLRAAWLLTLRLRTWASISFEWKIWSNGTKKPRTIDRT